LVRVETLVETVVVEVRDVGHLEVAVSEETVAENAFVVACADDAAEVGVDHALLLDSLVLQNLFEFGDQHDLVRTDVASGVQLVLYLAQAYFSEFVHELGYLVFLRIHNFGFLAQFVHDGPRFPVVFSFGSVQVSLDGVPEVEHVFRRDVTQILELRQGPARLHFVPGHLGHGFPFEVARLHVNFPKRFC